VRERKKEIRDLVVARVGLTGASVKASVPTTIANAWREWEGHFFAPFSNFLTPWDAYADFPGPILQAEAAPPPLP
jgi:hypothetical protein